MIIDTSAWIEFFNGSAKGEVVKKMLHSETCHTSAITLAELSDWASRKSKNPETVFPIVKKLSSVIDLNEGILVASGIIKNERRKKHPNFGLIDSMILATAMQWNLKVLTRDRHFAGENAVLL